MGGQTLILILRKVPATFTGQKLHRKIGLIFLYFSINLLFFLGRNEFLPSFAAPAPQLKLFRCTRTTICQGDHFLGFFKLAGAFAGFPATQKIPKKYSV